MISELALMISIGVFIWYLRKDSKDDYIRLETKLEAWRKENNDTLRAIQEEMKEFHGRLCAIEERKK